MVRNTPKQQKILKIRPKFPKIAKRAVRHGAGLVASESSALSRASQIRQEWKTLTLLLPSMVYTDIHTVRHTDKQTQNSRTNTDRPTNRQAERQPSKQTCRQMQMQRDTKAYAVTNMLTERQVERYTST